MADPFSGFAGMLPQGIGGPGTGGDMLGGVGDILSGQGGGQFGLSSMFAGGQTPQQQGYGIQPMDTPFQPQYMPGPQDQGQYAGTGDAAGLNFMTPGAGEAYQQQTQPFFSAPTNAQLYANRAMQTAQGAQNGSNRAEEWYQQFKGDSPSSLDPYYQQARSRGMEDINRAMAARGMLRSGAGNQAMVDAMTQLGAEQANREAGYQLQREGLGGQLARSADMSSLGQSQNQLGWLTGMGGIAGQADTANLNQVMGGGNLAAQAQALQAQRGRNFMSDIVTGMGATMPVLQQGYGDMLGNDQNLMEGSIGYSTGVGREALNQDYRQQERQKADEQHGAGMLGSVLGGII